MNLYLVRHGRTNDNESNIAAGPESPLSELGVKQAESIGSRLKETSFDKIYSSDSKRAVDTLSFIARNHKNTPVEYTEMLREYKKPSEMIGHLHESDLVQNIYRLIDKNAEDPHWHYSDEENYYDFRARLNSFLKNMEKESGENVLVITHSLVIRILTCLVLFGEELSATQFNYARWNLETVNTGITIFKYVENKWQLVAFNDIAHLAE